MAAIASEQRDACGLTATAEEIVENPYLLAEMYCGEDATDRIAWSAVDRGVLPSPELGGKPLADVDYNDERRFRALCVEHLRREPNHTFRFAKDLHRRNRRTNGTAARLEAGSVHRALFHRRR